ncbi:hypothetical protein E2C01_073718 [Portunus trituberculatus]|uniref:CCHC-type domain-containing protein n=1 Tax=Portunus trituberculatus TaxID=210409 RepID=A0A5B7IA68_PORTR|nr:hypothetical protein [Portunus trituberculatus]
MRTLNISQVKSLLKLQCIHDIEIEASILVSMNSCRGVASHRNFVDMDSTETVDFMADQDVIEARKITKMIGGIRSTASVIFTLSATKLPERIHVRYESVPIRPYISNPLRCFKCQLYGNHGNACRFSHSYCGRCAGEGHSVDQCTSLIEKCRNFEGAHSTFSRDCPAWKVEKEVCTVKTIEGIFYYEARMRVKQTQTTPVSSVSYDSTLSLSLTARMKRLKKSNSKLECHRPSHVIAAPAPSKMGSHACSLSTSSRELIIDVSMDVTISKDRERSPSSASERKRT